MTDVETLVIGAGVIGLATARALSATQKVYLLESEKQFGMHISSHNSEVIHSGIYYPSNFLKTRFCIQGRKFLMDYCQKNGVAFKQTGKLIVAKNSAQETKLKQLQQQAINNGIINTQLLGKQETLHKEPKLDVAASLWIPGSGILDSHTYMQQLEADIFNNGSTVLYQHHIRDIKNDKEGFTVQFNDEQFISSKQLILCAGLNTQQLALGNKVPTLHPCKGHYFSYQGKSPFSHLIYPLPEKQQQGLGIHATLDLAGNLRFGPDTYYQSNTNNSFEPNRKDLFEQAIKQYFPTLNPNKLQEAYTGIRPKTQSTHNNSQDFIIQSESEHGIKGLIQCFGIESPGLTASMAIAQHIKELTALQW